MQDIEACNFYEGEVSKFYCNQMGGGGSRSISIGWGVVGSPIKTKDHSQRFGNKRSEEEGGGGGGPCRKQSG